MITKRVGQLALVGVLSASLTHCAKKDEDEKDEETETARGTTPTGGGARAENDVLTSVSSLGDLRLSSALAFSLPTSLTDTAAALRLVNGKKSREACEIGDTMQQAFDALLQTKEMFCHFEVEKDTIVFGQKYTINFGAALTQDSEENESFGLWIDNSKQAEGKLTVYMCEGARGRNKIEITGVTEQGAKGTVARSGTFDGDTYADSVVFDAGYSKSGDVFVSSKSSYLNATGDSFKRLVSMTLRAAGVNELFLANKGSWQGSSFAQAGAVRDNGAYGQALFNNTFEGEGVAFSGATRAYFNSAGEVVDPSASPAFAAGGDLDVKNEDVPAPVTSEPVATFGDDEWDCVGEPLVLANVETAEHDACSVGRDHAGRNCYDDVQFEGGQTDDTYDESKEQDPSAIEAPSSEDGFVVSEDAAVK